MKIRKILIEAIVVGLSIVIFGTISTFLFKRVVKVDLPLECKDWNKNYAMEISLFMTGFIAHIVFEVIGLNRWYCKNY